MNLVSIDEHFNAFPIDLRLLQLLLCRRLEMGMPGGGGIPIFECGRELSWD